MTYTREHARQATNVDRLFRLAMIAAAVGLILGALL
jgi:hypothetical protein